MGFPLNLSKDIHFAWYWEVSYHIIIDNNYQLNETESKALYDQIVSKESWKKWSILTYMMSG